MALMMSCVSEYQVPADKIRIRLGAEPPSLNRITAQDAYASEVNGYLYDSLIQRNRDTLEWEPKIASRWEVSEDKKTYTFYLRQDVKWHDGTPVTAADVVFSYNLIMNPKVQAAHWRGYYQDIESVKEINPYTVQFKYKKIYFLALSFCGGIPMVPKHLVSQYEDFEASPFSRNPVGNGPFKFKKWVTNTKIILERNEEYWGEKPEIKTIEYKIIPDAAIGLQVLKKGLLDFYELTSIQWTKQTGSEKFNKMFRKIGYPSPGYSYIGWNNDHPIFKNAKVRRAMTHMVNRKKMNEKLNFGLGKIVVGPFFPFGKQYNKDIKPFKYDPNRSKELLKEAGWTDTDGDGLLDKDNKPFRFTFLYPSASKNTERISTILKEELIKLGVDMNIVKMEWAAFLDRINKREFDATMLGWGTPIEGDPYQVWDMSGVEQKNSSNFISYKNKEASELIRKARVEFDEVKRNELYWKFQDILHEEQPYTFMFNKPAVVVVSRRFDNVKVHKTGLNLLEWTVADK